MTKGIEYEFLDSFCLQSEEGEQIPLFYSSNGHFGSIFANDLSCRLPKT